MPLSKDAILAKDDLPVEELFVPEWNDTVRVRALSGRDRDELEMSMLVERDGEMVRDAANGRAKIAVRALVDESGNRIFANGDANELGKKSGAALDRIMDVAARLSKLGEEQIKETAENFSTRAGNGAVSLSPSP